MSRVIEAYKVLKRYPTLNEKFQIGDYLVRTRPSFLYSSLMYTTLHENHKDLLHLSVKEVESFPEFFEKVKLQIIVKEIKDDE